MGSNQKSCYHAGKNFPIGYQEEDARKFQVPLDIPPNPAVISEVTRFNKPKKRHRHIHIYMCLCVHTHTHTHFKPCLKLLLNYKLYLLGIFTSFKFSK